LIIFFKESDNAYLDNDQGENNYPDISMDGILCGKRKGGIGESLKHDDADDQIENNKNITRDTMRPPEESWTSGGIISSHQDKDEGGGGNAQRE